MALASTYPFVIAETVTFRDLDVLGHVNNAVYFTWFETARTRYLAELLDIDDPRKLPVILAETSCKFRAPSFYSETIEIGCGVSRLGGKSFDLVYAVAAASGRLLATGASVLVYFDYARDRTAPIPDTFRRAAAARQGGWTPPAE